MSDLKWCLGIHVCGDKISCPLWHRGVLPDRPTLTAHSHGPAKHEVGRSLVISEKCWSDKN